MLKATRPQFFLLQSRLLLCYHLNDRSRFVRNIYVYTYIHHSSSRPGVTYTYIYAPSKNHSHSPSDVCVRRKSLYWFIARGWDYGNIPKPRWPAFNQVVYHIVSTGGHCMESVIIQAPRNINIYELFVYSLILASSFIVIQWRLGLKLASVHRCWSIVNCTPRNTIQYNCIQNAFLQNAFLFEKMHFKLSSTKCQPFCSRLDKLTLAVEFDNMDDCPCLMCRHPCGDGGVLLLWQHVNQSKQPDVT